MGAQALAGRHEAGPDVEDVGVGAQGLGFCLGGAGEGLHVLSKQILAKIRDFYSACAGRPLEFDGDVYRSEKATGSRNYTQCDSLLIGDKCGAHTVPYIEVKNSSSRVEHEATTSKVDEDQLFYCRSRGLNLEDAINIIISGFCKEVFKELPMEFAVEAQKLLGISLEGAVG